MSLISLIKYSDDDVIVLSKIKYQIKRKPSLLVEYDDEGWYPLHHAVHLGYVNSVRMLLSMAADPNVLDSKFMTPLHFAAYLNPDNDTAIIRTLLDYGADPDIRDYSYQSVLHCAVSSINNNLCQIINMLIGANACIDAQDEVGLTALNILARYSKSNEDAMQLLIDKGANTNLQDSSDSTPLHTTIWAHFISAYYSITYPRHQLLARKYYYYFKAYGDCMTGSLLAIEKLINITDVNLRDINGNTALHLLLHFENSEVLCLVNSLISRGADINIKNNLGETALHVLTKNLSECGDYCNDDNDDYVDIVVSESDDEIDILTVPVQHVIDPWNTSWENAAKIPGARDQAIIKLLIDNGANLAIQNDDGNKAGHYLKTFMDSCLDKKIKEIFVNSVEGECCICMNDTGLVECNFEHGYCNECLLELGSLHCSMCGNSLIYRKGRLIK